MLNILNFFKFGIPTLIFLVAVGFGSQFVKDYRDMATVIESQKTELRLLKARDLSYRSRIDIRDQAIALSSCSKQIQEWVKTPSKLPSQVPQPFSFGVK